MSRNGAMSTGLCPDANAAEERLVHHQAASNEATISRETDLGIGYEVQPKSGKCAFEQELVAALSNHGEQQQHYISSDGHRARVSGNAAAPESVEDQLDAPNIQSVGRIWCLRLGMTADAWDDWGIMHVNPAVAMSYFLVAETGHYAMNFYQLSGIPTNGSFLPVLMFVSLSVYTGLNLAFDCTIWRYGPKAVDNKLFPPSIMIASLCAMPYIFLAYLGPLDSIPFNNRLHFTIANALGSGLCVHGLLAGKSAGDRPPKPRKSLFGAFVRATIMTLQFTDALTDMSMIATMLDEKAADCLWFGQLNRCNEWNGVIAVFSICAAIDFICIVTVLHIGKEKARKDKRSLRRFFALEALCSVCEFGMVTCTLIYLFSLKAASSERTLHAHHSTQIVLSFVSLAATCTVFVIRMIGVSQVLRATRVMWQRVSNVAHSRTSGASTTMPHFRGTVVPLPGDSPLNKELLTKGPTSWGNHS